MIIRVQNHRESSSLWVEVGLSLSEPSWFRCFPGYSDKFDITKHKQYRELADFDKRNTYDVEKDLKHELVMTVNDEFEMWEDDGED